MFTKNWIAMPFALLVGFMLIAPIPGVWAQRNRDIPVTPRGELEPGEEKDKGRATRQNAGRVLKLDKQTARKLDRLSDKQMIMA